MAAVLDGKVSLHHVMERPARGSVVLWSFRGRGAVDLYAYCGSVCAAYSLATASRVLGALFFSNYIRAGHHYSHYFLDETGYSRLLYRKGDTGAVERQ